MELTLPMYNIKETMPSIGGGVHPGIVGKYMEEVGKDIVLAAGGAVQGHPSGATAGARAMRQAIDCAMDGENIREYAEYNKALKEAIEMWGVFGEN